MLIIQGYVPGGYLSEPLDEDERQATIMSPTQSGVATETTRSKSIGNEPRIRRLSDPRLPHYLSDTLNDVNKARENRSFDDSLKLRTSRNENRETGSPTPTLPLPLQRSTSPPRYILVHSFLRFLCMLF